MVSLYIGIKLVTQMIIKQQQQQKRTHASLFYTFPLICFYFHRPQGQHTRLKALLKHSFSSLVPSGPKCVSTRSEHVNKQNKQTNIWLKT